MANTKLLKKRDALDALIADRKRRAVAADTALADLVDRLLGAKETDRPALIAERAALSGERDALDDELAELQRRRDVADLAIFEYEVAQAQIQAERLRKENDALRSEYDAVLNERRVFYGGRPIGAEPGTDRDAQAVALETRAAELKARLAISARDLGRARSHLEHVRAGR